VKGLKKIEARSDWKSDAHNPRAEVIEAAAKRLSSMSFMCYKMRRLRGQGLWVRKQPIILTDEIVPSPALVRAGLDALPAVIRARGERASRRFIEFFTANIRNRNTRAAYGEDQNLNCSLNCAGPLTHFMGRHRALATRTRRLS
jgi:hypothetical protein